MKKFWLVAGIVVLAIVALGFSLSHAKDSNNLDQYDDQLIADVIQILDNFNYPLAKEGWSGWIKYDQYGQKVTTDQRIISLYYIKLKEELGLILFGKVWISHYNKFFSYQKKSFFLWQKIKQV